MTESERIKRQLYACALAIYRDPPPGVRIRIGQLSFIIENASPEPGQRPLSRQPWSWGFPMGAAWQTRQTER